MLAARSSEAGALLLLLLFTAQALCTTFTAGINDGATGTPSSNLIGINYGRVADNLPSPARAVAVIQSLGVGRVRIFDADADVLAALANTALEVVITVKNEEILDIAASEQAAIAWVQKNVVAFLPSTRITYINVGNEILSGGPSPLWVQIVPAMTNIYSALFQHNLADLIKVTTSSSMDVLSLSYPPSSGTFRADIAAQFIAPLLHFLAQTRSPFFLNVYPYLAWLENSNDIPLSYALFNATNMPTLVENELNYYNLLDAQLDAVASAMAKLGFPDVAILISETGWPSAGGVGANAANAGTYNQRLVAKVLDSPNVGTPLRPNTAVPTFIFALFNENLKPGHTTERNWGVFYANGTQVYPLQVALPGGAPANSPAPSPTAGGGPSLSPVPPTSTPAKSPVHPAAPSLSPVPTASAPVPSSAPPLRRGAPTATPSLSPVPTPSAAPSPNDDYDELEPDSASPAARPQPRLFHCPLLVLAVVVLA